MCFVFPGSKHKGKLPLPRGRGVNCESSFREDANGRPLPHQTRHTLSSGLNMGCLALHPAAKRASTESYLNNSKGVFQANR